MADWASNTKVGRVDLITTDEAQELLGRVSRETMDEIVSTGGVNQYRLTPRVIRYSRREILGYLERAKTAGKDACDKKVEKRKRAEQLPFAEPAAPKKSPGRPRKQLSTIQLAGAQADAAADGREAA